MKTITENKKVRFNYTCLDFFQAGIILDGCEIKSIRNGDVNLSDSYCAFVGGELFVKNMYISRYKFGGYAVNVDTRKDRKLLLTKHELRKLEQKVKTKGMTVVPVKVYINDNGFAKLEISLVVGKHGYDKSKSIKERDIEREVERYLKEKA